MEGFLTAQHLTKTYGGGRNLLGQAKPELHAVQDISFSVNKGESLGIVGESGCGKSTLARMLVGLLKPTSGSILINGAKLSTNQTAPADYGRLVQYVFQDPISALNPRKKARQILEAPLIHLLGLDEATRKARLLELFEAVNLRPNFLNSYPHELSGGQAQRVSIARALAAKPEIIVLDEPVSALDVSVQAQILNLLKNLRQAFNLTYVFISHDLAVVEAVSDQIAALYFGRIVEIGKAGDFFKQARHPYTRLLAKSVPVIGQPLWAEATTAELPNPLNPPLGCAFATRCESALDVCRMNIPEIRHFVPEHGVACFNPAIPANEDL